MRSVNYIDAIAGPNIIEMEMPSKHVGKSTRLVKRDGNFSITIVHDREILAILHHKGDEITILATANQWIAIL